MANRDPEPESQHQQFSDEYLEKQKAKELEEIITLASTPFPGTADEAATYFTKPEEPKSGQSGKK